LNTNTVLQNWLHYSKTHSVRAYTH